MNLLKFFQEDLEKKNKKFAELRQNHEIWKNKLMEMNKPFFMIPTDFSTLFLKDISGGALKLYIFLGLYSKYRSGESWYANDQIGTFFDKDPRTISKWFKELEDLGLIFRAQKGINMKANTFLLPYGFFINEEKKYFKANLENIKTDIIKSVEEKEEPFYGLILNSGIQETTLAIFYKKENLFSVTCFFELNYQEIKSIRSFLNKINIPSDNFEIDVPLAYYKYSPNVIYKNLMRYFEEKNLDV